MSPPKPTARRLTDDDAHAVRVAARRRTAIAAGLFCVVMLLLLGGQFLLIKQQRDITRRQLGIAQTQLRAFAPLLEDARPLAEETRRGLPRARAIAERADRLTRTATPLVQELRAAGLPESTRELGVLVDQLLGADTPATLRAVSEGAQVLTDGDRLTRTLRSAITVLGSVRETQLVPRAAEASRVVVRVDRTQRLALAILKETQELQRQALTVARETRDIARATQGHARNLDRKVGGEAPAAARRAGR